MIEEKLIFQKVTKVTLCECGDRDCHHYYVTAESKAILTGREVAELLEDQELP